MYKISITLDKEPPRPTDCPADITIETSMHKQRVSWNPPRFVDNSGLDPMITTKYFPGALFALGQHLESYN